MHRDLQSATEAPPCASDVVSVQMVELCAAFQLVSRCPTGQRAPVGALVGARVGESVGAESTKVLSSADIVASRT